jgi:hypothetical protein
MPSVQIRNVPALFYSKLKEAAIRDRRSISNEALHLIEQVLHAEDKAYVRLFRDIATTRETVARRNRANSASAKAARKRR